MEYSVSKETIKARDLTIFNKRTGEIVSSEVIALPRCQKIYNTYFMGSTVMFTLFHEFDLTQTEQKVFGLLLKNLVYKNLSFYNQDIFAKVTDIHPVTIRKSLGNLKKLNLVFHVKKEAGFTILRISPHLFWYGKPADFFEVQQKYPEPLPNLKSSEQTGLLEDWAKQIKKQHIKSHIVSVPRVVVQ